MDEIRMAFSNSGKTADIYIYDDIGQDSFWFDSYSVKDMKASLAEAADAENLNIRINSLGGDPYQAIAMHSLLKDSGKNVTCIVDGIAASAASVVAMSGTLEMRTGSQLMIHNPSMMAYGTADDLERTINQLKATTESAIDIYEAKSGKSRQSISKMMTDETWLSAQEAKNEGFADSITETEAVSMSATPEMAARAKKVCKHIPEAALSLVQTMSAPTLEPKQPEAPEVKVSETPTNEQAKTDPPADPNQPQVIQMSVAEYEKLRGNQDPEKDAVTLAAEAERTRVTEIHSVCQMAGIDATTQKKYIDEGTSLEIVQKAAITAMSTNNPPASDGGDQTADEDASYRKEYRDAINNGVAMTASENEYVNVRRREDGKATKTFDAKEAN